MKERPILFSGPMVRAILDGRKTQTRRVVKAPKWSEPRLAGVDFGCPYGAPGDRLWVRETWADTRLEDRRHPVSYRASWPTDEDPPDGGWKPSIFMPRWASRITLEVVSLRVERVQEITEEDAWGEGCPQDGRDPNIIDPRNWYANLWDSINGKPQRRYFEDDDGKRRSQIVPPRPWSSNPWVWVIEFSKLNP